MFLIILISCGVYISGTSCVCVYNYVFPGLRRCEIGVYGDNNLALSRETLGYQHMQCIGDADLHGRLSLAD
ncbi:hypothetical protein M758_1G142300 [Ceratodon purpureus]|nr:hypothetical protein M758_1G142300 [Ceratodon purpureus]